MLNFIQHLIAAPKSDTLNQVGYISKSVISGSIIILMFHLTPLTAFAQQRASFEGRVADEDNEPIPGITVLLKGQQKGAITDGQGKFAITSIQPATYTIEIFGIGFEKQEIQLTIKAGKNIQRSITLKERTAKMKEIVVVAESEVRKLKLSAKAVAVIETREAKFKSADLGEVLAKTEGISVRRAGGLGSGTRFSLNGLSGDQIRFFYNGIPLEYTPYAFGIANVPVNLIERLEVYKGVVPIQFGADALGGAVNLVSPDIYNEWAGSASYQIGSFNTHRVTGNINYADDKTGLFVVAGGFYDYTDNNYKIDAAVPNEKGQLRPAKVRRFHDGYRAFGTNFRLGVRNKKWAGELSVEMYYGDYDNEVQNSQSPGLINEPALGINNAVVGSPFGEIRFTSFSTGANLHYNITPTRKWSLDLKAGYNYNERQSIDTGRCLYDWFGNCVRINNEPGELGEADNLITISESAFVRQRFSYTISDKNVLSLSVAPTYSYRTGDDLLVDGEFDPALDNSHLFNLVIGLEHSIELLDGRLANIAFVKNYRQNVRIESLDPSVQGTLIDERSVSNFGAGNGVRYDWSSRFSTKLSYEYAIRLPRQDEIFGDGQLILENLALHSESSHNLNLQCIYGNKTEAAAEWQLQGNFFVRQIDDLIFLLVGQNDLGSFQNVWSATSQGFELSGRWKDFIKGLTIVANTTYQQYLNTSDSGPFESFKGDRIPNTPYFFANGAAAYQLRDVLKKNDNLSFFWNTRFVRSFFIGWESAGLRESKSETPNQTLHTAGLTHRMEFRNMQTTAITLEVQNLANAKIFDFFGVQRPGRAFFIKSTIQF